MKSKLLSMADQDITKMLTDCESLKPKDLIISPLKWKYLVRSVLRGKNTLILGPTRCGKTKAAQSVAKALGREDKFFYFNLGAMQDARASLIGNTFFNKETGTIFKPSQFVQAIQTDDAIILLDELSRGHHDAWNILMTPTDPTQRYLRLDESESFAVVKVKKVTFLATANVGNEYTATKVMDKALTSRFPTIIEMDPLEYDQEMELLKILYPDLYDNKKNELEIICHISNDIKTQCKMDDARITTFIPTGTVIEMADLVSDGFDLQEIVDMVVLPVYSDDGGTDSERLFVKLNVEKYLNVKSVNASNPIVNGGPKKVFF